MKAITIWCILGILIFAGCKDRSGKEALAPEQHGVSIRGVIENGEDVLVTIDRMGPNAFIPVDSVRCDENGAFEFNIQSPGMDFYALNYTDHGYITLIIKPGDQVQIYGNPDALHPYRVMGSEDSKLVHDLAVRHKEVLGELQLISLKSEELQGDENYSEQKLVLNQQFDSITQSFQDYSYEFIKNNAGSPSMLIALYNQYGPRLPVFSLPADIEVYRLVDSVLFGKYPENEALMSLRSQIQALDEQLKLLEKKPVLSPGMKAPDFVMKTNDEQMLSLSELKGSYVLLQFWASWSKPSQDENPYLEAAYNNYKNRKFTILQVSVDDNEQEWHRQIEGLEWKHVSDLNRWESPVVDLYEVERIPSNFLLDPGGVIIAKDVFGEEIEATLEKYLK